MLSNVAFHSATTSEGSRIRSMSIALAVLVPLLHESLPSDGAASHTEALAPSCAHACCRRSSSEAGTARNLVSNVSAPTKRPPDHRTCGMRWVVWNRFAPPRTIPPYVWMPRRACTWCHNTQSSHRSDAANGRTSARLVATGTHPAATTSNNREVEMASPMRANSTHTSAAAATKHVNAAQIGRSSLEAKCRTWSACSRVAHC